MSEIVNNVPVRAHCVRLRDLPPSSRPSRSVEGPAGVALLRELLTADVARGVVVVGTCSRLDVYLADPVPGVGTRRVVRALIEAHLGAAAGTPGVLLEREGADAVSHLFRTATGLDSPTLGDVQVLGQLRDAFVHAQEHASLDPLLYELFRRALRVGSLARHETSIAAGGVGIATVVRDSVLERRGPRARDENVLVVGAGDAGASVLRTLHRDGFAHLTVVNRSRRRALEAAVGVAQVRPMGRLADAAARADVIIGAVDAPAPVLDASVLRRTSRDRLVIDVARPRCTSADLAFDVVTLDDLVDRPSAERLAAVPAVEEACRHATRSFLAWHALRDVDGALRGLYRDMDELIDRVVADLSTTGFEDLDRVLRRRLWSTLHPHIQEVRRVAGDLAVAGAAGTVAASAGGA